MRRQIVWLVGGALLLAMAGDRPWNASTAEEPAAADALRPGLIVTYRDFSKPTPNEFTTIEPTIALALKPGEAPHPRLTAGRFTAKWEGQIKILRAGTYSFNAHLSGELRMTIDGKIVIQFADKTDPRHAAREPVALSLKPGNHPLVAEFDRVRDPALVQVFWSARHFHAEPIPFDVVGHLPGQEPARLTTDQLIERGRFLAEEHNCTSCHRAEEDDALGRGLKNRPAPDLSKAGERLKRDWIAAWLREPRKLRPQAAMPCLFENNRDGALEAQAVAEYLVSLNGPINTAPTKTNPNELRTSIARGERLFNAVGCTACHTSRNPIKGMGAKTTLDQLARFLLDPLAIDPSGRMPKTILEYQEAQDLSRYLCQDDQPIEGWIASKGEGVVGVFKRWEQRPDEVAAFARLPPDRQWVTLGHRLVIEKRCNSCHKIEPGGKPFAQLRASADFNDIKKPAAQGRGCLAEGAGKSDAPCFALSKEDRAALCAFLSSKQNHSSPAPLHAARVALERFNCLACHSQNGQGGLTTEMTDLLRQYERAENAEAVSPPPLTGVGDKLTTSWMRKVLTQAGRARPWMGLRMPQFGEANVGHLPEALAACEGIDDGIQWGPPTAMFDPVPQTEDASAGRFLVGKKAFGCISCHDIAGVQASGTRGPDLALMNQRVRYGWYRRWLQQPQKMQPGTKMPTIFMDGRSIIDDVLGGEGDRQAGAMWSYLSLGPNMPLPEGLEPPKGLVLTVKDRPIIVRTFMPDAGSKAIAIGYPDQVSVAFDAVACRLAYAWSGIFLDASPVWNDRGGNPARPLGPRFWDSPPGFPWTFTSEDKEPDFANQARDPAFGASVPEGKVHQGPMRLHFDGYTTDKGGTPAFRYRVHPSETEPVEIRERIEPRRSSVAVGIVRDFELNQPAGFTPWLLLGETASEVRVFNGMGLAVPLDLSKGTVEIAGRAVLLPYSRGAVSLVKLEAGAAAARLVIQRQGNNWQVLLRLPRTERRQTTGLTLSFWRPYKGDDGSVLELLKNR